MTPREEAYLRFKAAYLRFKATIARQIEDNRAAQHRIATGHLIAVVVAIVAGALAVFVPLIAWLLH